MLALRIQRRFTAWWRQTCWSPQILLNWCQAAASIICWEVVTKEIAGSLWGAFSTISCEHSFFVSGSRVNQSRVFQLQKIRHQVVQMQLCFPSYLIVSKHWESKRKCCSNQTGWVGGGEIGWVWVVCYLKQFVLIIDAESQFELACLYNTKLLKSKWDPPGSGADSHVYRYLLKLWESLHKRSCDIILLLKQGTYT